MRTPEQYTSKQGMVTYKIRYRIDGRSGATSFSTIEDAEKFNVMIDELGIKAALEMINEPTSPKRIATGPTVTECVERYISTRTEAGTRNAYTAWLRLHIAPIIGDIRINKLTREDVQFWVSAQKTSSATILRNHILLSSALKEAKDRGDIRTNPAYKVPLPRILSSSSRTPLSPHFTREEYALIRKAIHPRYTLFVEFLAETGARIGEAAALTPADINLDTGKVNLIKTYSWQPGIGYQLGSTKTLQSKRTIVVKQSILERLDLTGPYVFTTERGEMIKDNGFRAHHWKRALLASGLPAHRHGHPHDLRHAHANWLLDDGVSLSAVSARLGHTDVRTTLSMYGHPSADSDDRILAALEGLDDN